MIVRVYLSPKKKNELKKLKFYVIISKINLQQLILCRNNNRNNKNQN